MAISMAMSTMMVAMAMAMAMAMMITRVMTMMLIHYFRTWINHGTTPLHQCGSALSCACKCT
eukprot:707466-Alexandrium_andersonii.AAC.1